jgi:hypothetical protein
MAQGDITFFEEALDDAFFNGWASADTIKCAILDNTATPTAAFATPALGDFTEVGTSGTYTAGGYSLGTWGGNSIEAGGTLTFDSATNPVLTATASNDADAFWALLYNDTQTGDPAFAFVDLGGPIDGTAATLTINWNATGIFTIS